MKTFSNLFLAFTLSLLIITNNCYAANNGRNPYTGIWLINTNDFNITTIIVRKNLSVIVTGDDVKHPITFAENSSIVTDLGEFTLETTKNEIKGLQNNSIIFNGFRKGTRPNTVAPSTSFSDNPSSTSNNTNTPHNPGSTINEANPPIIPPTNKQTEPDDTEIQAPPKNPIQNLPPLPDLGMGDGGGSPNGNFGISGAMAPSIPIPNTQPPETNSQGNTQNPSMPINVGMGTIQLPTSIINTTNTINIPIGMGIIPPSVPSPSPQMGGIEPGIDLPPPPSIPIPAPSGPIPQSGPDFPAIPPTNPARPPAGGVASTGIIGGVIGSIVNPPQPPPLQNNIGRTVKPRGVNIPAGKIDPLTGEMSNSASAKNNNQIKKIKKK